MKIPLTPVGTEPMSFRFVPQHLNHCATAVPLKGKSVPLLALTNPDGSRKLRFHRLHDNGPDGGKVVSLTYRPTLPPRNTPGTHFC